MADHWALTPDPHVEGGLVLYGFKDEVDAERFAELNLPDWVARPVGERQEGHRSICAECGTPWPCAHQRVEREASAILHNAKHACHVCGESTQFKPLKITVKAGGDLGQDLVFHGRLGKCRNAAIKLLTDLGRDDEVAQLEAAAEARREHLRERKERNAQERQRLRQAVAAEVNAEQTAIAEGVM